MLAQARGEVVPDGILREYPQNDERVKGILLLRFAQDQNDETKKSHYTLYISPGYELLFTDYQLLVTYYK